MSKSKKDESNVDFTRFQNLTKRLVAVPKREIDEERQREMVTAPKDQLAKRAQ